MEAKTRPGEAPIPVVPDAVRHVCSVAEFSLPVLCILLCACSGRVSSSPGAPTDAGDIQQKPFMVLTGLADPVYMASDGTSLFIEDGTGRLLRVPVGGGAATTLVTGATGRFVFVDDQSVYFIGRDGLYRVPKRDGPPARVSDANEIL